MTAEDIRTYCLEKNGVEESFPFDHETLVFKVGNKMFLLISLEKQPVTIAVKTNPEWSETLREQFYQIQGAFHMNKTHWNSVELEGLQRELIFELIDHSYDLIFKSLTKKLQQEILQ
ncbi:MmcQ/YjbR family DNA-binding protein [Frigoriflavimonas asaccharolytica]|uniref:Putative DNA-binding protein (MmcQ/YjbR family) n=1 Tax=Frigoriflavimonas asaccharolytica TaxID=2735899 RepID=A0A8J8G7B8_9FLAO|nr:MmcQ/YjbR family DNA-binding protein [Frigoriflavimonas asaccharolytica]NRS92833.1 putative DNA-binding protein (MmcQ/YjbR family) [Frigoriflavimonas asaccharolytica]